MIDENTVREIWDKAPFDISLANVEFIIAEYENSKMLQVKPQEVYQVHNKIDEPKTFYTFKELTDYLEDVSDENSWDCYDLRDNVTVFVTQQPKLEFDVAKRYTVTLK